MLSLAAAAAGQEFGVPVGFGQAASFSAELAGPAIAELPPSDALPDGWNVLLWQGRASRPELRHWISREAPDGSWGPWLSAQTKVFANGRFWARVVVPGGGRRVRMRLAAPGAPGRSLVEIFSAEVFAQQPEPPPTGALPAPAHDGRPPVFTREQWSAKPPREPYEPNVPSTITVHHTAGVQTRTAGESLREVQFIQDFHQNGRGWNDIGYHYLIDAAGRIFEGRPENAVGAHALNHNAGSLGVAFLGTYHPPQNHPITPESLDSFVVLGRYLSAAYGIAPADIDGHRDVRKTACPGDALYALLPQLRARVAAPAVPSASISLAAPAFP